MNVASILLLDSFCKQKTLIQRKAAYSLNSSRLIQGYPQRMRLQRRLYEIYTLCFLIFTIPFDLFCFFVKFREFPVVFTVTFFLWVTLYINTRKRLSISILISTNLSKAETHKHNYKEKLSINSFFLICENPY